MTGHPSLEGSSGITRGKGRVQIQDDTRNILTQGKVSNQVIKSGVSKRRPGPPVKDWAKATQVLMGVQALASEAAARMAV